MSHDVFYAISNHSKVLKYPKIVHLRRSRNEKYCINIPNTHTELVKIVLFFSDCLLLTLYFVPWLIWLVYVIGYYSYCQVHVLLQWLQSSACFGYYGYKQVRVFCYHVCNPVHVFGHQGYNQVVHAFWLPWLK